MNFDLVKARHDSRLDYDLPVLSSGDGVVIMTKTM